MDTIEVIEVDGWRVLSPFVYEGMRYGPGDAVPPMPLEEAERLRAAGSIGAVLPDGTVETRPLAPPQSVADYLLGTDIAVLRRVRMHRPDKRILRRILETAAKSGRSQILIEALKIAVGED